MEALAVAALGIVAPYIARGAEEFARQAGVAAFDAVRPLALQIQKWWRKEPVANAAAEQFVSDPKKYAPILTQLLAAELEKDPAFAAEIQKLVDAAGPYIEVVQKIEVAKGVTGADIDELVQGTVQVRQEMKEAEDVTGFKAKRVGR